MTRLAETTSTVAYRSGAPLPSLRTCPRTVAFGPCCSDMAASRARETAASIQHRVRDFPTVTETYTGDQSYGPKMQQGALAPCPVDNLAVLLDYSVSNSPRNLYDD